MNLVSFSIKTKGIHNFARRLWTVCTRFSFSEARTHQALHAIISSLQKYNSSPTFFIPGVIRSSATYSNQYPGRRNALYLDLPEGLGTTRKEQVERRSALVERIERLEAPLLRFGCWPDGSRAALAVSGDLDSVTIQDFFLRVLEVKQ
jgi:hypothetical protein